MYSEYEHQHVHHVNVTVHKKNGGLSLKERVKLMAVVLGAGFFIACGFFQTIL